MILVPPSARLNPTFGNKPTMRVGSMNVVFMHDVINVIPDDDVFRAFTNNETLRLYLEKLNERVRYYTLCAPATNRGTEFLAWLSDMDIVIENTTDSPYNVEFSGSRFALTLMVHEWYFAENTRKREFVELISEIQEPLEYSKFMSQGA
jgi:hypothetical protein